jgi:hypothetical protein
MAQVQGMLSTHPRNARNQEGITQCIQDCQECAVTCMVCADACLDEEMVEQLKSCIRMNLDCADICETGARVMSRQVDTNQTVIRSIMEACATVCRECAAVCKSHASRHEHCRICAEMCRRCENTCRQMLNMM